jgi:hypothetical protein
LGAAERYTSFVMAMIIPITTNTTIAICIQIQAGDIRQRAYGQPASRAPDGNRRETPRR